MNRKFVWITLSVVLVFAMVLTSCAPAAPAATEAAAPAMTETSAAPAAPAAAEMVTIRWRTRPDNQAEQDVYQKISDTLSAQLASQGIKLQYDPAPVSGYFDKLTAEYSAGNAPDIAWVGGANVADYANLGVVMDLMPLAKADTSFKLTDYYDAPMKELENAGHLWGLPRDISTFVMYYNKDLFKKYNVPDPAEQAAKGEWTWDNFLKASQAITNKDNKTYGFAMSNWWGTWGYFVYAAGGSLFNADRTACNMTDPKSIAGLQFMSDLFSKYKVSPAPGMEGGVGETEWHAGTVGMFPNGRWQVPGDRANDKFDWGVVEMPTGPGGQSTWLNWGAYIVSAKTKYPAQAWIVMKALTSPDVQAQIASMGTNIPSNKSQTALDAFMNSKPPADNTPFINGTKYAVAEIPLYTGNWNDIVNNIYQPNIDKIFAGQLTAADAAKAICDAANPLFKKP
jgi:multiple sugar transport system substrate-binding protein